MKNRYCKENGWTLLRFSDIQVNNNLEHCVDITDDVNTLNSAISPEHYRGSISIDDAEIGHPMTVN